MNTISIDTINGAQHQITSNGEVRICCVNCDDNKFHLYCNIDKKIFHCFKCGFRGKITANEESLEDFNRTIDMYLTSCLVNIPIKETGRIEKKLIKNMPIGNRVRKHPQTIKAFHYLRNRGMTEKEIEDTRVITNYAETSITFPVYSQDVMITPKTESIEYFVTRNISNTPDAKYINAPWPKHDTLYKFFNPSRKDIIVVVEGIFDALAVNRAGYNSIALLGKEATQEQVDRLKRHCSSLLIWLDDDAFSNATKLAFELSTIHSYNNRKIRIVTGYTQDPADIAKLNVDTLRSILDYETLRANTKL